MSDRVCRAKFYVDSVTLLQHGNQRLKMVAMFDDGIEENKRFAAASPSGEFTMLVSNPALAGAFRPGRRFYLDFTEAPDSPTE